VLRAIGSATAYFSILPGGPVAAGAAPDAGALVALPLVGAAIGALAGCAALGVAQFAPHPIAAATALVLLVTLSGAIHLDGFLDGCDAFFASVPAARRREILKDPHHGTYAAAGLLCVGVTGFAALLALPPAAYPAVLAFSAALARAAAISNAFRYPRGGPLPAFAFALSLAAIAGGGYLVAKPAALLVPVEVALSLLLGRWIAGRLDNAFPGDAYGFIATLLEIASLVAATTLLAAGRPPGQV
jgi:adenosylcobinamide-GDP ribazoletransferase